MTIDHTFEASTYLHYTVDNRIICTVIYSSYLVFASCALCTDGYDPKKE